MRAIVPMGEGRSRPLSLLFPSALVERIDAIAEETGQTRANAVRHLLRAALRATESLKMVALAKARARNISLQGL